MGLFKSIDSGGVTMDLIVTGWIGLEATAMLAKQQGAELRQRFRPAFVRIAAQFEQCSKVERETLEGHYLVDLTGQGILSALWEVAEAVNKGLEIDLRKIPIRQETVEICEYFDINPYYVRSGGAFLIATEQGAALRSSLQAQQILATKIGSLVEGKARIIWNDGHKRYLDRPKQEELARFYEERGGE